MPSLFFCLIFASPLAAENRVIPVSSPHLVVSSFESETQHHFAATLNYGNQIIGKVEFYFFKSNNTGRIELLAIEPEYRRQSFGSTLLTCALDTLSDMGSTAIYWSACPLQLPEDQTRQIMLPKLIAFYERHGAQTLFIDQVNAIAQMAYYPGISANPTT
jgi:GNAT superfamily N-acetyltransferase